jgi:hypothetical protein
VDEHKKSQDLKHAARGALNVEALEAMEGELRDLLEALEDESVAE